MVTSQRWVFFFALRSSSQAPSKGPGRSAFLHEEALVGRLLTMLTEVALDTHRQHLVEAGQTATERAQDSTTKREAVRNGGTFVLVSPQPAGRPRGGCLLLGTRAARSRPTTRGGADPGSGSARSKAR